jgi:starch synthase (maltosyl-transferring)
MKPRAPSARIGTKACSLSKAWEAPTDPTGPRFHLEDIFPRVDGGRYAVKRVAGESVEVWADIFREGHDVIAAALLWRADPVSDWQREPMVLFGNDRWHGHFTPPKPGLYLYAIEAWTEQFGTWRKKFVIKQESGQDISLEAAEGLELIKELMPPDRDGYQAAQAAASRYTASRDTGVLLDEAIASAMAVGANRPDLTRSHVLPLVADRERARAGAWYEMVPRSQSSVLGRHGTFADCSTRVPEIAALGFDVLYLTPIHPIGRTNRKGKNNS